MNKKELDQKLINEWHYNGILPKNIAFWLHCSYNIIWYGFFKHYLSIFYNFLWQLFLRSLLYDTQILIVKYKLRNWSKVNTNYILTRWWNFKIIKLQRLYKERYMKNMQIIAQISKNTGIPQHVLIAQYGDIGNCTFHM